MSPTVFFARKAHVFALLLPCLVPLFSGCDLESYPSDLEYPLRADPIVDAEPQRDTWDTILPGQLEKHMAGLKELGGKSWDPSTLPAKDRQALAKILAAVFGTPAAPKVDLAAFGKDADGVAQAQEHVKALQLDDKTLAAGSKVYRRHCMHCHGVSGDGRGPTGPWINPSPRDYRQGLFKFISAAADLPENLRRPRRADVHHILDHGIEGTAMPSFSLLREDEKQQLISYVMHLSLRGEVEFRTMKPILDKSGLDGDNIKEHVQYLLTKRGLLKAWNDSNNKGIQPDPYPYKDAPSDPSDRDEWRKSVWFPSVSRGYRIFAEKREGGCIECHRDFGRQTPFKYDKWGTLVRPANLTTGVYRGGRRPIDLYWRIRGGIYPSGMPKSDYADKAAAKWGGGKYDPYWDLVNFLQALPYPHMLPPNVKTEIYGPRQETATRQARR